MYIVHLCSELTPIAKVGGLGDVVQGLAKETVKNHHKVDIILPKYDCLDYSQLTNLEVEHRELWSFEGSYRYNNTVWSAQCEELKVFLIEPHHPSYYFGRGMIYGCPDDIDRFLYFCRTALEYLFKAGKHPNVIHIHDWPTAAAALLYKEMYLALGLKTEKVVLTIHNLQHQGRCAPHNLSKIGLRGDNYLTPKELQDPNAPDLINLLKGGIEYSDQITTVSPNYEKEILTPAGGFGLHTVLIEHKDKLHGILNGIDANYWDPQKDPHVCVNFNTQNVTQEPQFLKILAAKKENKKHIQNQLSLEECAGPMIACITRLVPQKGPELIRYGIMRALELGGQFVLLGSSPIPEIEKSFQKLQKELAQNKNVKIVLERDEALAHKLFAGADLFFIPSIFEPCGLTQLIALRYATIPIARMTGGLVDTVADIDTSNKPIQERNGFTFDFPDAKGVDWAFTRAFECYSKDKDKWNQIIKQGIAQDFSWTHPTQEYLKVYKPL
jgi:starch synthase